MNVGINGVSARGGRWMFSQRGRSRRNTVSAGRGPGLLCLSTHRPGGQRLKHAPLPDPRLLLQYMMSQWSKFPQLTGPSPKSHIIKLSLHVKVLSVTPVGTQWTFGLVLVCVGCCHCESNVKTQNIRRGQIKEGLAQCCSWVCYTVFWCRRATGPFMCKAQWTVHMVAKFTLN